MNSQQSAPRITDVVPANFLCDNRTMEKIAESQLLDERALESLGENLSVLESRQRCLKDELTTVERLISDAVAEQTRLRSSIATHKSLLSYSPVRALPGEVLSQIFLHYIAIAQSVHQDSVFQEIVASHRIHTTILQVCRRWRTTALADPRLWTTIPLIGSGYDHDEEEHPFAHPLVSGSPEEKDAYWQALECRIERTSALPLNLLFHFTDYGDVGDPIYTISSMHTFIRLFPRASSISLSISSLAAHFPEFSSLMDNKISHADRVHTARVDVDDATFGRKILSAIPNVEVLEAGWVDISQWFIDAPTAGHRLRSLQILNVWSHIPLVELLDLLDGAPLLETLKLGQIFITTSVGTLRVVTHTLLSTFHLAAVKTDENDAIFAHLTLPALQSLSVGTYSENQLWPRSSNVAFIQRSGCRLTDLAFRGFHVDEKRLVEMLTAQKALVTLQLNLFADDEFGVCGIPIPLSILEFLSTNPKGASDRPLPALEVIRVVVLPQQLKAVKRLIQSRYADQAKECRIATLREVDIHVPEKQSDSQIKKDEHAAMFAAFVNKGIGIRISYK
ncbi:hypothetical protein BDZ89DRAFT_807848 [Hymenopellis radicata]|nr:hypothetical protein BDZ89DRAFT_807848 [Hymenopellis radicata]